MTYPLDALRQAGQSLWLDGIERGMLVSGELAAMVGRGDIQGAAGNYRILQPLVAESNIYDLAPVLHLGAGEIFWHLVVEDARNACDIFLPLHERTAGAEGYVSLEIDPRLLQNTQAIVAQAHQLWQMVNRPNLMINIPATRSALPAIRQLVAAGINIHAARLFSLERYKDVMTAYMDGLEDCLLAGGNIEHIHSLASFVISEVDEKMASLLPEGSPFLRKTAIAHACLVYAEFIQYFSSVRFGKLQLAKANYQRLSWESTAVGVPGWPDTWYVDRLVGPATVNTLSARTLQAFCDHGNVKQAATLLDGVEESRALVRALETAGMDAEAVLDGLEQEVLRDSAAVFGSLLDVLEKRRTA